VVLGWSLGGMFALLQATTGTADAAAEAWSITVRFLRDRLAGAAAG
jgi:hypothetical protein